MFTGIIEKTGRIKKILDEKEKIYFTIEVEGFLRDVKIGNSIACDGVCLTVVKKGREDFAVELMPETLRLTKFSDSKVGDLVNLEKAMKVGDRLDGHFVMGHVDGVGVIKDIGTEGKYINLVIKVPAKLTRFLPLKGSVAVNGVSLTISGVGRDWFKVSLISHTLKITNLSELKKGSKVNIEIDMIARYLYQFSILNFSRHSN